MIIRIPRYSGRFGNRILQYFNLLQIAEYYGATPSSVPWEGSEIFCDIVGDIRINSPLSLDVKILSNQNRDLVDKTVDYNIYNIMGNLFFDMNRISTFDVLKLKNPKQLPTDKTNVALHFRGDDFIDWNKNAIMKSSYYINSIEFLSEENCRFYIFTDDTKHDTYKEIVEYVRKYDFILGNPDNKEDDFTTMADCDVIVSSPSTFCICAGFVGKKEKRIIHNTEWINDMTLQGDKFWSKLNYGGNNDYKLWKKINN